MARIATIAFVALLLATPGLILAQAPPEWQVNDDISGQEYQHDVAGTTHSDGSWTAVWLDFRLGYPALFTRSFDALDAPLEESHPITDGYGLFGESVNPKLLETPVAVPIGERRSLLVWSEERGGRDRLRAMRIDPSGPLGEPVIVSNEAVLDYRSEPSVSIVGNEGLIAWTEGASIFARVRARRIDSNLGFPAGDFPVHPESSFPQTSIRIAAAPDGWVAIWQERQDLPRVLLRKISTGGVLGPVVVVDEETLWTQQEPAIHAHAGGLFVTWIATYSGRVNIHGRAFDAELTPVESGFLITPEGETVTPRRPELLSSDAGSVLAIWTAGPAAKTRFYSRTIQLPATPAGEVNLIEDPPDPISGVLVPRSLSAFGDGAAGRHLLWWDNRDGWDLVAHLRITAGGQAIGTAGAVDIEEGTASQLYPAVALYPNNRAFVAWEDFRTGGLSIYGAFLDNTGRPEGRSFRISESTTGSVSVPATNLRDLLRNRPAVGITSDGYAAVAWTLIAADGQASVHMQNFDPAGVPLGNNSVLTAGFDQQQAPQIAPLPGGGYFVVWRDAGSDNSGEIFAQPFLSDGTVAGDTIRVVDRAYTGAGQESPTVGVSGTGEVVVAWLDDRRGNFDVFAQRLGPTGVRIQTNRAMSAFEGSTNIPQLNPTAAAGPDRFVVAWDDNPLASGFIIGMLVILPSRRNAAPLDTEIPFSLDIGHAGIKYPRVAMEPGGQFVLSFWDTRADSARMMAQRFDSDGTKIGTPYSILGIGGEAAAIPGAVAVKQNLIQYVYTDSRLARGWDVTARRVNWTFDGEYSAVALNGWSIEEREEGIALIWSVPHDRAGARFRVWRQEFDGVDPALAPGEDAIRVDTQTVGPLVSGGTEYVFVDGSVEPGLAYAYWIQDPFDEYAGPWVARSVAGGGSLDLQSAGNPFRESVRLRYSAGPGARFSVTIHDASGRRVRTLHRPETLAGAKGEIVWDGRDERGEALPAGAYWARLRSDPGGERAIRILRIR